MKIATIQNVTYYAKTAKIKGRNSFYPIIEYVGSKIGLQSYHINTPQETRSKALTIAKQHIRNIQINN